MYYYCKQCDHHMEVPAWDGKQTVCPECGTMVWGGEDERKASEEAEKRVRILDEALEKKPKTRNVSCGKARKNRLERYLESDRTGALRCR